MEAQHVRIGTCEDNVERLRSDLAAARTQFSAWPIEAHLQMSTFCDASCIMCWNGANPPTVDVTEATLDAVGELAVRGLRLVVPHDGSEPLARRWRRTHEFARQHGIVLDVTTNAATLTPRKLEAALDVVDHVSVSIDSHEPALFERIRPGIRAAAVFANTVAAVAACDAAGIPISANVVLMTENLETVHDTVAWLGTIGIRSITVIRLKSVNGEGADHDPFLTHGPDAVALAQKRCEEAADRHAIELWWCQEDEPTVLGPIEEARSVREATDNLYADLAYAHPGVCRFAYAGLRVQTDGATTPCGFAAQGELELGNLADDGLDAVWNGPSSQDLRRAMYTRDLPALCSTCIHAQDPMPALDHPVLARAPRLQLPWSVGVQAPRGVIRSVAPPTVTLTDVPRDATELALLLDDGEGGVIEVPVPISGGAEQQRVTIPAAVWDAYPPYAGRWFTVVGTRDGHAREHLTDRAWALVRSPWMDRIEGSALRYESGTEVTLGTDIPVRRRA